jgi:hypothetical protein
LSRAVPDFQNPNDALGVFDMIKNAVGRDGNLADIIAV